MPHMPAFVTLTARRRSRLLEAANAFAPSLTPLFAFIEATGAPLREACQLTADDVGAELVGHYLIADLPLDVRAFVKQTRTGNASLFGLTEIEARRALRLACKMARIHGFHFGDLRDAWFRRHFTPGGRWRESA